MFDGSYNSLLFLLSYRFDRQYCHNHDRAFSSLSIQYCHFSMGHSQVMWSCDVWSTQTRSTKSRSISPNKPSNKNMTSQHQSAVTSSTTKPCCPRSIFWTNLVLLGFDPSKHAVGAYSAITFDQDVFTGVNNVKAMEPIVWFLFNKLEPNKAKKVTLIRRVFAVIGTLNVWAEVGLNHVMFQH